jgi:hypothetical protein
MLVGVVVFVASTCITVFLKSPEITPLSIAAASNKVNLQDPVILTVVNQDGGMVCNEEKYVRLRVYKSGRIEGEGFTERSLKACKREKKTAILDARELYHLRNAIEQRELFNGLDKYPQYAIYTDTYLHSEITFGSASQKRIALTNPELDDPRNLANYPAVLVQLLREIDYATSKFGFKY